MNEEEMICKNCKYHYIEEISFDHPQSCCDKRKAVIEEWFNCNDFEYSDKYIEQLQQENKQLKDNWNIIKQEMLKIRQSTFSKYNSNEWDNCLSFNGDIKPILDKMQELEGSDSNE